MPPSPGGDFRTNLPVEPDQPQLIGPFQLPRLHGCGLDLAKGRMTLGSLVLLGDACASVLDERALHPSFRGARVFDRPARATKLVRLLSGQGDSVRSLEGTEPIPPTRNGLRAFGAVVTIAILAGEDEKTAAVGDSCR
jgi:hypothetical protein